MTPFPLKIVTPDGVQFDGQAEELIVRSTTGDIGIMAGHINCVAPLGMGRAMVLVDGQRRDTLTHGTNISGSYTRVGLNQEEPAAEVFAGANEVQMYFPAQDGRLLVPVSRTVYSDDDVATAVFEFLRGPKQDSGLETPLESDVQLLGVSVKDGVVTINFTKEFTQIAERSDGGVQAMRALMMTCTRYPGIKKVKILVDGEPYQLPVRDVPTFANVASDVENSYPEVMLIE